MTRFANLSAWRIETVLAARRFCGLQGANFTAGVRERADVSRTRAAGDSILVKIERQRFLNISTSLMNEVMDRMDFPGFLGANIHRLFRTNVVRVAMFAVPQKRSRNVHWDWRDERAVLVRRSCD